MKDSRIWDFWANRYERLWVQKYSLSPTRKRIISRLRQLITDKSRSYRILDSGCGTGQLLRDIREEFREFDVELTGIDYSDRMIAEAAGRGGNIRYAVSDIEEFRGSEKAYDIIVCSHSFPYYRNKQGVIESFCSMLKDNGCLILAQASQNNLYDSLVMPFVKLTTSKAAYPSVREVMKMLEPHFGRIELDRIKERFYMPSIYMFTGFKL
ncbi:MAG TPA: class I SAM-dependent methyltransferase [Negativicutes bacterium]|nr:class I SAM-dependent methyltransferase [Negativicutes bacterium]